MDEKKAIRFLRSPSSAIIDLAIQMANLTWKEELAITLCARKAMTRERAAEEAGYSVDAIQKWYRSGMQKLCTAWNGIWWIEKLSED